MKDINDKLIELGDKVVFPGPYGGTLCMGRVIKSWTRQRRGHPIDCVRVVLDNPELNGKRERDCYGNADYTRENNRSDMPVNWIAILEKAGE